MLIAAPQRSLRQIRKLLRNALVLMEKTSWKANCLYYRLGVISDFSSQFGMFIFGIRGAKLWIIIINIIVRDCRWVEIFRGEFVKKRGNPAIAHASVSPGKSKQEQVLNILFLKKHMHFTLRWSLTDSSFQMATFKYKKEDHYNYVEIY